jgi:hypothetical protein
MQPGWYVDAKDPAKVAYFDGTVWESSTDRSSLPLSIQQTISQMPPERPDREPLQSSPAAAAAAPPRKNLAGLGWLLGIAAGAILIISGIAHGFTAVGRNCGAPFKEDSVAEYMDAMAQDAGLGRTTYAADCKDKIESATGVVWVLVLIGVLLILASAIIMAILRSAQTSRAAAAQVMPTAASQIEDLARLRDKGLVTPDEFELKKQEQLRRV